MLKKEDRGKIIFSADDFGVNKLTNANILKLAQAGKLDRVEVMINNYLKKEDVLNLAKTGVKLDIHLHLIEYDSDYWQGKRNLERGMVERICIFIWSCAFGKNNPQKVALKWENQIKKFKEIFGQYPDGIGSHEHIHYFPFYFKILLNLSTKYEIAYIRFGKRSFGSTCIIGKILDGLRTLDQKWFKKTNFKTSDFMVSFDWFSDLNFLREVANGENVEVVFHPERAEEFSFLEKT
jgi:predicted glycoside hydrolase/deacetylase ChbG (UPF0249 family)